MATMSGSLAAEIARQHGVVTSAALIADGFGHNSIRRAVTAGTLIRVHCGVLRVATAPDTFEARCVAACLADESILLSGPAGARLWQYPYVDKPDHPIVLVEHGRRPIKAGVETRQTNILEEIDVVRRPDGIRVANPVRTWFDCARDMSDERFEMLTEWVLDRHAAASTLWTMLRRMQGPGRDGVARVRRVLGRRPTWQKPADSGLELRVLTALERRGVGPLVRQHRIRLDTGIDVHPDGALPEIRWAVEVDHVTWHGGRFEAQRDKGRDRQLRRVGWQVDRVTDQELADDFHGTIDELVELIALRRREFAA